MKSPVPTPEVRKTRPPGTPGSLELTRHQNEMHCLHELCSLPLAASFVSGAKSLLASLFIGEQHNQTNNLTLLLISELGFPFIKKTMVSQGNIPLSVMLMLLQKLMTCFGDETAAEIRRRGMRGKLDAIKAAWN